jgi:hypothetical protein
VVAFIATPAVPPWGGGQTEKQFPNPKYTIMKTYDQAPEEVHDRAKALIRKYHPELEEVGIRIDILMASTDTEDSHAVTLGGYPCHAVIRNLGPKERAMGRGDVEIVIALDKYAAMTDAERDALLDHELYHLEPRLGKYDKPKFDDHHRPLFSMRKHDRQFGWFDEIARRHGDASFEVQQAHEIRDEAGQLYFDIDLFRGAEVTISSGGKKKAKAA